MRHASVSALKARLSEYLAAVREGEQVIITDRGRPVARLCPLPAAQDRDARLEELVRAGILRPPAGQVPSDFSVRRRPPDPQAAVLRALLQEREEGP